MALCDNLECSDARCDESEHVMTDDALLADIADTLIGWTMNELRGTLAGKALSNTVTKINRHRSREAARRIES